MKRLIKGLVSCVLSLVLLLTLASASGFGASSDPSISFVAINYCKSTSCAGLATISVYGRNFTPEIRTKLNDGTSDIFGRYVGGDGSTKIITDFTNLVSCQKYSIITYFPSSGVTVLPEIQYVYNPDGTCLYPSSTPSPSPTATPAQEPSSATPPVCDRKSPDAPQLSGSATGTSSVYLAWSAAPNATHYMIRYGLASGQYIYGVSNVGNTQSTTIHSLAPATKYYFQVAGVNDCAGGSWSNEFSIRTSGASSSLSSTGSTLGAKTTTPTPSQTEEPQDITQEVKAVETDCAAVSYVWWLPLVLQLGASLLYAAYAAGKEKKGVYLLPIVVLGIVSQLANILLGCNCATGVWCERYWAFNIGIVIISLLISRVDLQDE